MNENLIPSDFEAQTVKVNKADLARLMLAAGYAFTDSDVIEELGKMGVSYTDLENAIIRNLEKTNLLRYTFTKLGYWFGKSVYTFTKFGIGRIK